MVIACSIPTIISAAGRPPAWVEGAGRVVGNVVDDIAERAERRINANRYRRDDLRRQQRNLQVLVDRGDANARRQLADVQEDLNRLQREDDDQRARADRMAEKFGDVAADTGKQFASVFADKFKAKDKLKEAVAVQETANKATLASIDKYTSKENITKLSVAAGSIGMVLIATYFAAKFGLYYAQKFVGMPKLVRESSDKNLWETILSMFSSEEEAVDFMSQVVFDPELTAIISELSKATQETRKDGLPFRNLLLYGEPGTGKTMIAKLIARHCGMNYVIISGADFIQFGEGAVQQIHELFDRIENSDVPYIVFIDEATSAFRSREGKDLVRDAIVDAILSRTGAKSDKFMLILAANDVNLDWAILSRISKKVHVPLPALNERVRMLQLYLTKYFVDRPTVLDGEQAMIGSDLNEQSLRTIAQELTGWSGRDLEDLVGELRYVLSTQHSRTVTPNILKIAADEKLKQRKELVNYGCHKAPAMVAVKA